MTTIAWDNRYLAADTLGVFGDNSVYQVPCHKLLVQSGHVFAATGRITDGFRGRLIEWWLNGADIASMPAYGAGNASDVGTFIVIKDGQCGVISYICPDLIATGVPAAFGSGADYAVGAIEAGANAMEAVLIAMKHDINTGGEVEFVDTHDLDSGVQRYCQPSGGMIHASSNVAAATIRAAGDFTRLCKTFEYPEQSAMFHRLLAAAGDPTTGGAITITKPRAPIKSDTGANLWADDCTGRLVLGTGCGGCLRCNREWWALLKHSRERVSIDCIRFTLDEVRASLTRAPEGLKVAPSVYRPTDPANPDGRLPGQALLDHVEAWNAASAVGDAHRMKGLDVELRSLTFPPGVQLVTEHDLAAGHMRKVIIDGSTQPTA